MDSPVKHIYDHPGTKKKSEVWKYFGLYKKDQSLPPTKDNLDMEYAEKNIAIQVRDFLA